MQVGLAVIVALPVAMILVAMCQLEVLMPYLLVGMLLGGTAIFSVGHVTWQEAKERRK
jgi:hypothetical protein